MASTSQESDESLWINPCQSHGPKGQPFSAVPRLVVDRFPAGAGTVVSQGSMIGFWSRENWGSNLLLIDPSLNLDLIHRFYPLL